MAVDLIIVFVMGIALGYVVSSGVINYKWIDAANNKGFVRYNRKFYKVTEIAMEGETDEQEDTIE